MSALFIVNLQGSAHIAWPQSVFVGGKMGWKEGGTQTQGDNFLTILALPWQDAYIQRCNLAQQADAAWVPRSSRKGWETQTGKGLEWRD